MVDAAVSKTAEDNLVRVRLPLPALGQRVLSVGRGQGMILQAALNDLGDGNWTTIKGEEKQDDGSACAQHGALPRREGERRHPHIGSAPTVRRAVWERSQLRGQKTDPNPDGHR
jgi:hypothetical protein